MTDRKKLKLVELEPVPEPCDLCRVDTRYTDGWDDFCVCVVDPETGDVIENCGLCGIVLLCMPCADQMRGVECRVLAGG